MAGQRPDRLVRAIAIYKFAKAALLTAVGLGTLRLLQPRVAALVEAWTAELAARHERSAVGHLLAWVSGQHPRRLEAFAIGSFLFAGLFLTEGLGLWLGKRWAQYLTVIATTLFVPLEVFEIARRVTPTRLSALALNLAVVVLLVDHLRRHSVSPRAPGGAGA